jgi:hypothetical protein
MLNTKPIKKNYNLYHSNIPNLSSDTKNTNNSDKIIQLEGSKQKQLENIVKQANLENDILDEKVDKQTDNQLGGINENNIQNPVLNREFTYDRYKDNNLNVSNLINGEKMFINNSIDNNLKTFTLNNQNNFNGTNNYGELIEIKWNDVDNSYIILNTNSNEIEYKINNESILRYILNNETNEIGIKKYLFIISWNQQMDVFEFNFLDTIFTNNFDMMIKLQNFIYDTLINFDNLEISDTYNYKETIIMFYFQMIIFLFNNYEKYLINNEQNKISRIYSSIVYRFSSLILKNTIKIKSINEENNKTLNDLMLMRSDVLSQINFMDEKLGQFEKYMQYNKNKKNNILDLTETDEDTNYSTETKNSNENIVNSRKLNKSEETNETDETEETEETSINNSNTISGKNMMNAYNINKNGKKITKIKDFFTEELQINTESSDENNSDKYDSDKNGYYEINDAFGDFYKFSGINNKKHNIENTIKLAELNNVDKIIPPENSFQSNIKSYTTNKEYSYNPNSALKNSKILNNYPLQTPRPPSPRSKQFFNPYA